jgi:hypothetical protein
MLATLSRAEVHCRKLELMRCYYNVSYGGLHCVTFQTYASMPLCGCSPVALNQPCDWFWGPISPNWFTSFLLQLAAGTPLALSLFSVELENVYGSNILGRDVQEPELRKVVEVFGSKARGERCWSQHHCRVVLSSS